MIMIIVIMGRAPLEPPEVTVAAPHSSASQVSSWAWHRFFCLMQQIIAWLYHSILDCSIVQYVILYYIIVQQSRVEYSIASWAWHHFLFCISRCFRCYVWFVLCICVDLIACMCLCFVSVVGLAPLLCLLVCYVVDVLLFMIIAIIITTTIMIVIICFIIIIIIIIISISSSSSSSSSVYCLFRVMFVGLAPLPDGLLQELDVRWYGVLRLLLVVQYRYYQYQQQQQQQQQYDESISISVVISIIMSSEKIPQRSSKAASQSESGV